MCIRDRPLVAAMEFIVTGGLIYIFIARFGEYLSYIVYNYSCCYIIL
nr:hypothetical protein [Methanobrevibacter gottschalkii]